MTEPEVYVVETILDKKIKDGKVLYFLAWKGYGPEENTWEPKENMGCPELIKVSILCLIHFEALTYCLCY